MSIEDNKEAMACMENTLGSLQNRMREIYNKGYKDGYRKGSDDELDKLLERLRLSKEGQ